MTDQPVERFRATSGRITGVIAVVLGLGTVVLGLVDREAGFPGWLMAGAFLGAVLAWAAMLRPRVWLTEQDLVLRNMFHTVAIPLAAIQEIAVRQVLAVRAGDRRYVSPAVGRTWRASLRANRTRSGPSATGLRDTAESSLADPAAAAYPDFVEERIGQRADDACAQRGIRRYSAEQVALGSGIRREPAWVELVVLAAASLTFVVTLVA